MSIAATFRRYYRLAFVGIAAALWAAPALAAGPTVSVDKVDASGFPNVRATVSVLNASGQPSLGLDASSFALSEDGEAVSDVRVEPFVDGSQAIAAALLVDMSGSMQSAKLDLTKKAAGAFVDTLHPADTASLTAFTTTIQSVKPLSTDHAGLQAAIGQLKTDGNTSLYDALIDTAGKLSAAAPRRRMIVLVTDGQDTTSRATLPATLDALQKAGVPVVSVGMGGDARQDVLDRISAVTGGSAVYPGAADAGLRSFYVSAEDRLRWTYGLTYQSHLAAGNQEHTLSVKSPNTADAPSASGKFSLPPAPLTIAVSGLTDLATVSGTTSVQVAVISGSATSVQLLVDGQERARADSAPFALAWNTAAETAGLHQVVVRASGAANATAEKSFVQNVVLPAPPPQPIPVPRTNGWPYLIAMVATVLAGVGLIWLFAWRARLPEAAEEGATADEDPDLTEQIQPLPAVAPGRAPVVPVLLPRAEDPITVVPLEPQRPPAVGYKLADAPNGSGAEIATSPPATGQPDLAHAGQRPGSVA